MLKKLISALFVFVSSATVLFAAPYGGASVGIQDTQSNGGTYNARVVPATLFAGYGSLISQSVYMAGELFVVPGSAEVNNNLAKTTYGYGASFIPGVMVNDRTLAYVRAGVVRSRFSNQDETVTGGQLGFGLQTSLTPSWDLRGEYVFTAYHSVPGSNVLNEPRLNSPDADQFNLGLVYKFE